MKAHPAIAIIVFWPWVLIRGPQLYSVLIGFDMQFLFWVIPAALLWVIIEITTSVRNHIG